MCCGVAYVRRVRGGSGRASGPSCSLEDRRGKLEEPTEDELRLKEKKTYSLLGIIGVDL